MLEIPGQPALSEFRLAKLKGALQEIDPRVTSVTASYCYFVAPNAGASLGGEQKKRLQALLLSGEKAGKLNKRARSFYVVPRPGTISPWSSKATEIARACSLDAVARIERGTCYGVQFKGAVTSDDADRLKPILHDRMTGGIGGRLRYRDRDA
jgi:phosphoribosylformylglycinamidine synthase